MDGHMPVGFERRISIPPLQVRRALSGGYGGCLCQWELKAPTDRSQSDCVHEQVEKADCECPLYDDAPLYKYAAYIRSGYRESKKVSRRLRKGINGDC